MPSNEDWPSAGARPWHEEDYTVRQSTTEHGKAPLWRVWRGRKFVTVGFKTREEAERTAQTLRALQRRRRR